MYNDKQFLRNAGCIWSLLKTVNVKGQIFQYEIGWIVNVLGELQEVAVLYECNGKENITEIRDYLMNIYRHCYIAIVQEGNVTWFDVASKTVVEQPKFTSTFPVVQSNNGIHFIYSTIIKTLQSLNMQDEQIITFLRDYHLMSRYKQKFPQWLENIEHEIGWSVDLINAVQPHFAALPLVGGDLANAYLYWSNKLSEKKHISPYEMTILNSIVKYAAISGRVVTLSPVAKQWIVALAEKEGVTSCIHIEHDEQMTKSLQFILDLCNDPRQQVVRNLPKGLSNFDWLIVKTPHISLDVSLYEPLLKSGSYILQCVVHDDFYGIIEYHYEKEGKLTLMKKTLFARKKEEGK